MIFFSSKLKAAANCRFLIIKIIVVFIFIIFPFSKSLAQYPGGLALSDMRVWFRADAGIAGTSSSVTGWTNQIGSMPITTINKVGSLTITQAVNANQFNYNAVLNFPGGSPLTFLEYGTDLNETQLFGNVTQGAFYSVSTGDDQSLIYASSSIPVCGAPRCATGFRTNFSQFSNQNISFPVSSPAYNSANIFGNSVNAVSTNMRTTKNGSVATLTTAINPQTPESSYHLYIGSFPGFSYKGPIAESIVFSRELTITEMNRVESYLAIKYGVTLVHDYISSSAATTYSLLNISPGYINQIIGLGRDDGSLLNQKQSTSIDDSLHIYLGAIAASNNANSSVITSDKSFVITGNNGAKMIANSGEIPVGLTNCSLFSRIFREWKISRTNFAQSFNMDFKLPSGAVPGSVNIADLRLLIDDDGNFSNGGTQCYYNGDGSGIAISYNNPVITITGINTMHIPDNATKFISIGSSTSATPLPVVFLYFTASKTVQSSHSVQLNWSTSRELNTQNFIIERSTNSDEYTQIGTVIAKGNSSTTQNYNFVDENPFVGTNYYRLEIVDKDEKISYSEIQILNFDEGKTILIYPNPAKDLLTITGVEAGMQLRLISVDARILTTKIATGSTETLQLLQLATGVYILQTVKNGVVLTAKKFVHIMQ